MNKWLKIIDDKALTLYINIENIVSFTTWEAKKGILQVTFKGSCEVYAIFMASEKKTFALKEHILNVAENLIPNTSNKIKDFIPFGIFNVDRNLINIIELFPECEPSTCGDIRMGDTLGNRSKEASYKTTEELKTILNNIMEG